MTAMLHIFVAPPEESSDGGGILDGILEEKKHDKPGKGGEECGDGAGKKVWIFLKKDGIAEYIGELISWLGERTANYRAKLSGEMKVWDGCWDMCGRI